LTEDLGIKKPKIEILGLAMCRTVVKLEN